MAARFLSRTVFVLLAVAALSTVPLGSDFVTQPFACDMGPSPDWFATIANVRHLISFGILSAFGFLALRAQPVWIPIVLLLSITLGVELEQAIFIDGHCRARDMIPNLLSIGIGWLLARAVLYTLRRWKERNALAPL